MFEALNNLIENEVRELKLDFYSVIIGTTPSKGARSPKLWNKVYEREKKKIRMIPLDVKDEIPSTVPPFISTVVIVPKSATVIPAFVQFPLNALIPFTNTY